GPARRDLAPSEGARSEREAKPSVPGEGVNTTTHKDLNRARPATKRINATRYELGWENGSGGGHWAVGEPASVGGGSGEAGGVARVAGRRMRSVRGSTHESWSCPVRAFSQSVLGALERNSRAG